MPSSAHATLLKLPFIHILVVSQKTTTTSSSLPKEFSLTKDPKCGDLVRIIRDQSTCEICWAFTAAGVIDASLCMATGGKSKEFVSTTAIASCQRPHKSDVPICTPGNPTHVLKSFKLNVSQNESI